MLTRAQTWRRQKHRDPRLDSTQSSSHILRRSRVSENDLLANASEQSLLSRESRALSAPQLRGLASDGKRKVRFSDTKRVVLVPTRHEYHKHGIHEDIWWEMESLRSFKACAKQELLQWIKKCGGNLSAARLCLYRAEDLDISAPAVECQSPVSVSGIEPLLAIAV
jgi:hypothetical protein